MNIVSDFDTSVDTLYQEIATLMVDLKSCVALTGAGISAESGLSNILKAVIKIYA